MYIQATNLTKTYAGQEVFKNISFTISGGQKVGLVGKNGCGKSTLFKILLNQEEADRGKIVINPNGARIGYLSQVIDSVDFLSSGEKTRQALMQILKDKPEMLILDEPTNHLDWQALDWLENIVKNFSGPVLLVSHDRKFLDNTVNRIFELEDGSVKTYGGNYTFYRKQKAIEKDANIRMYEEQQSRVRTLTERVRVMKTKTQQLENRTTGTDHYVRKKAAKSARAAISIERKIAKELAETKIEKPEPDWELHALFAPKIESSQTVVKLDNLFIQKGERIAFIGKNGSGKTTLIKKILASPLGNNVQVGYLSQDHQELNSDNLVLDELTCQTLDKTESYKLLRRFLLPPEKINQPVKLLSSGEQAKLLLAKIMTSGANFIVLDEPTNHLDIPSREAIEEALASYTGTLLVVSHDRYFLQRIDIQRYLLVDNDKISELIQ